MHMHAQYTHTYLLKVVLCLPAFLRGGAGSPSNTMSPEPRPTSVPSGILIHAAVWPQQKCAENWEAVPLLGRELGPHLTECGRGIGLPPCQVSSWSIQLFGHNTPTPQPDRQRSGSIGQTVLQTVAQKLQLLLPLFYGHYAGQCALHGTPN